MGRRSDHSREELRELILTAGETLMAEVGFANFSAREVAKRIGYSIGTIHNVFGSVDRLVTAINTRAFGAWADELERSLATADEDRIAALVEAYFRFARDHPRRWSAIYDHRPASETITEAEHAMRGRLMHIVAGEIATALHRPVDAALGTFARSLVATVHGHCSFAITGSWAAMGQHDAEMVALARVRESLAAYRGQS
ncbi:TetR/AcrR family transcriptional regulator [Sphingomonas radiodurans]|uniref:TetR/AcrR family transcriptional regulator n=1 Tax=Sphingomonas radiodurans TaxID=2890321 RepID=UPI001E5B3AB9|nr:TetR/AcrR family transcriptional regulator [Sphingomonas radiodurans]WBH15022.1 TetR/AcrR family transcriptional regulator [Sphingomonas radiodurans]